jgi:hypothetical protein
VNGCRVVDKHFLKGISSTSEPMNIIIAEEGNNFINIP